ncbi:maestro heat-like repeat-containing protein family member 2A [Numida meleagris]|uniref:maestro heat-like repeat-containing protein family member 2A n=1 Tax=Numida meleagris TaxID=8996 RepID=UPI000B3E122F|nr:maestro heat-like repeat-containing protein family member 2A [Numida meleagris]
MERLRALRGLFACVGCMPRRTRRGSRGRVASSAPACPVTFLLQRLQDREGDRAQAYCELESALWEEDSRPPCGVANRLLAEVSQDLTAAQGATDNVRTAASNVLVALARSHFSLVMAELQGHLKAVAEMSKEFALVTLSKLFSSYAPQCIAFMWLTLAGLRCVAGQVRSGRTLRVACAGECRPLITLPQVKGVGELDLQQTLVIAFPAVQKLLEVISCKVFDEDFCCES